MAGIAILKPGNFKAKAPSRPILKKSLPTFCKEALAISLLSGSLFALRFRGGPFFLGYAGGLALTGAVLTRTKKGSALCDRFSALNKKNKKIFPLTTCAFAASSLIGGVFSLYLPLLAVPFGVTSGSLYALNARFLKAKVIGKQGN